MTADELVRHARAFRRAIEDFLAANPAIILSTDPLRTNEPFPANSCKSTSMMFGLFLSTVVPQPRVTFVWGRRGAETHGWLHVDGMLVDLTGDQFPDGPDSVFVATVGESGWHKQFAPHAFSRWDLVEHNPLVGYTKRIVELIPPEARGG